MTAQVHFLTERASPLLVAVAQILGCSSPTFQIQQEGGAALPTSSFLMRFSYLIVNDLNQRGSFEHLSNQLVPVC